MIPSKTRQYVEDFDELVQADDSDFPASGLKVSSIIRLGRLAVISGESLVGAIGEVDEARLKRITARLAGWLTEPSPSEVVDNE